MNQLPKEVIAQCVADQEFTIADRTYKMLRVPYRNALKVIGAAQQIERGTIVIGDAGWVEMEKELSRHFMLDNSIISKLPDHFQEHPEDYMTFITYAIGMITYPFMKGIATS